MDADVAADVAELRQLLALAQRPAVQGLLRGELERLQDNLPNLGAKGDADVAPPDAAPMEADDGVVASAAATSSALPSASSQPTTAPPHPTLQTRPAERRYTSLDSFSWDEDREKVKVYLFLEGIKADSVESQFGTDSFDLKIHDAPNPASTSGQLRNLRCGVANLHAAILPKESKVIVKPKRVTVVMKKKVPGTWGDIRHKEQKIKTPKFDDTKDPMAGIMDLMKNMYDEGDEEMKKTIAKAWTESRTGVNDPFKNNKFDL